MRSPADVFFFSSRRRHTRWPRDWSSDVCSSDLARLAHAGSQLVRITVNTEEAAAAVPEIMRKLHDLGVDVPVIGDFHYNGHKLLVDYPEMARSLAKYQIGRASCRERDEYSVRGG